VRELTVGNRPAVQMVANVTNIATDACNGPVTHVLKLPRVIQSRIINA
jgi:hypothetical protein